MKEHYNKVTKKPSWMRDSEEAVSRARELYGHAMNLKQPSFDDVDLERGFEVSAAACRQQVEVPVTPIMKNMLKAFGDMKDDNWRLTVDDPPTKAEKWLQGVISDELIKHFGPKNESYDESLPLDSKQFYIVDCWRNFKDNMRQIQPGQEDTRRELLEVFTEKVDPEPLFRMFEEDPVMLKAIDFVQSYMPRTRASTDYHDISGMFMKKHTNVGFKWWYNDRSLDKATGKTYGQIAQEAAETIKVHTVWKWNVFTAFGRNQMKGRLIMGGSRPVNIWLDRLEAQEIEKLKSVGLFAGYNDEAFLKQTLLYILKYCESHDLVCANYDQSKFDLHINPAWLALIGSLREAKAEGALGKDLACCRAMLNMHSWVVDGMTKQIREVYGRMFSGFIDTNQGDGWVEAIAFTYCLMKLDPDYTKWARMAKYFMLVMGDDCLALHKKTDNFKNELVKLMAELGFEVNKEKGEYGVFFLQNRLFKTDDGRYVMVYPWTRVLRSMLFTENKKGLGPYGWLLAQYQQLAKLKEYPPALDAVVSIIYAFDKLKLGVDLSVDQILEGVNNEDTEATADKGSQYTSTTERLFDGDPTKSYQFNDDGSISKDYLTNIHAAVRESVQRVGRHNIRQAVKSGKQHLKEADP